jgi:Tetratricopeptide repeat.
MNKTITLPFILILSLVAICGADEIYSKNRRANELYKQGEFDEALKLYEDALLLAPSDEKLKMNQGAAQYKLGDYRKAEESYNGALSIKDKKARAAAHYNMGNILYKKAEQSQTQDLQGAQQNYKSALQHYIESLDLSPDDIDAKWNLQLTHQRIKQLEQQQQQQQNQQNKDDKTNRMIK